MTRSNANNSACCMLACIIIVLMHACRINLIQYLLLNSVNTLLISCIVLTEDQFVEELLNEPNKDWYTLGFLLGLSEPDVKEIGLQYRPRGTDACLGEVFRRLRCRDIKVTWEKIVDALFSSAMGNEELAKIILKKFCPDHQSEKVCMQL